MPLFGNALQGLQPQKINRAVQRAEFAHATFQRVVLQRELVAIGQQAALDALDQVRAAGRDVEGLPGLPDQVPQGRAQPAVIEVDLEAALLGVATALHQLAGTLEVDVIEVEEADAAHHFAKYLGHQVLGLRALHREDGDIRLDHRYVQPGTQRQALGQQQHVGVGDGQPELVFCQFEQNRVVDHAAFVVNQWHVHALPDPRPADVAWRHPLHQAGRIGPGDLDLALAGHVP